MKKASICITLLLAWSTSHAQLEGYWAQDKVDAILERTTRLRLDPDLTHLSDAEQEALKLILQAGELFQQLYEQSLHPKSQQALLKLQSIHKRQATDHTKGLLDLYRLFKGPIGTTLRNQQQPFLPVEPHAPGRNVYPWNTSREELEQFLTQTQDDRNDILDERTIVRKTSHGQITWDRKALIDNPILRWLHPELFKRLDDWIDKDEFPQAYYAVPYAVAYAQELAAANNLLNQASRVLRNEDADFSSHLRARALGLLTNDYEAGDATWVRGQFNNLNAQIGSFETYDDKLYGVKSFFSLSALALDKQRTQELEAVMDKIQSFEDSLPYEDHKRVQSDIPIAVYNVIADFGQSRGANTATILPNDPDHARKYGRTILLRSNIMRDPTLFQNRLAGYKAAVVTKQEQDLTLEANFKRTLWHEVGHYLGPDRSQDHVNLDEALAEHSNTYEELKADLVSLYLAPQLRKLDYYDDAGIKSVYASGIRRMLQKVKPRRDQAYQTMQLMQQNYFLKHGALTLVNGQLQINYDKYHGVVTKMLKEVLDIQTAGDKVKAEDFIELYAQWNEEFHGKLAQRILDASPNRYTLITYAALGE